MNYFALPVENNSKFNLDDLQLNFNEKDKNVFISKTLHQYLNNLKKEIDKCISDWDNFKKYTNVYEFIHTTIPNVKYSISKLKPVSRSFYKMIEICNIFNLLERHKLTSLESFHIAEGPGGFIDALCYLRSNDDDRYYGMTLINNDPNVPGWKKNRNLLQNKKIILEYGKDNTGNILNKENLEYCYEKYNNKFDLVTADGGFDFSCDFNLQENMASNLIFAEVCFAIATQKINGCFILKIFDIFSKITVDILRFLCFFYEKIYVIKPFSSRLANSEKYVICLNFKKVNNFGKIINKIIENYSLLNDSMLTSFLKNNETLYFINKVEEINAILGQQQMENISQTLSLIHKKYNNNSVKFDQLKNQNLQKCIQWCIKNNIPHNNIEENTISENFFLRKNVFNNLNDEKKNELELES